MVWNEDEMKSVWLYVSDFPAEIPQAVEDLRNQHIRFIGVTRAAVSLLSLALAALIVWKLGSEVASS